jgi:hypothetical protein
MDAIKQGWVLESTENGIPMYYFHTAQKTSTESSSNVHRCEDAKPLDDDSKADLQKAIADIDWDLQDLMDFRIGFFNQEIISKYFIFYCRLQVTCFGVQAV